MEREIRYASVYQRQMPIHIRTSVATTHGGIQIHLASRHPQSKGTDMAWPLLRTYPPGV